MEGLSLIIENSTTKENFPFKWALPTFYTLDKNLQVIYQSQEQPVEWRKSKYIHPRWKSKPVVPEEVYVTLLSLFLEKFAEEGLSFINRSYWSTYGEVDLTALDNLWRVHLFEVKNEKCNLKEFGQLEDYFRATSFENLIKYVNQKLESKSFSDNIFKVLMFGLYAGAETSRISQATISKEFEKHIKTSDWKDHNQKAEYLVKYLQKDIFKIWSFSISEQEIRENVIKWYDLLKFYRDKILSQVEQGITLKWLNPQQKTVLWLVGTDFHTDVIKQVTSLRGSKIDYRLLKMEVRLTKEMNQFFVKIQKEDFPQRDKIIRNVSDWINRNRSNYKIRIQYYLDHSPSGRKKPGLGHCLSEPKVEIFDEKFKLVKWH